MSATNVIYQELLHLIHISVVPSSNPGWGPNALSTSIIVVLVSHSGPVLCY